MAFEYLDLENKVYIPTQQLISQVQTDLAGLYAMIRQSLIEAHGTVAALGKELYDNPLETLALWYNQAVAYSTELYAGLFEQLLPQAEHGYQQMLAAASDYAGQARDSLSYVVENPEQVSAEAIAAMTETLSTAGDVSSELVEVLQHKSAEIVALLLEQPVQTMETAARDILAGLLNIYFELVNAILVSL